MATGRARATQTADSQIPSARYDPRESGGIQRIHLNHTDVLRSEPIVVRHAPNECAHGQQHAKRFGAGLKLSKTRKAAARPATANGSSTVNGKKPTYYSS